MRITSVLTTPVAVPLHKTATASRVREGIRVVDSVVVQVMTDEGLVGLGEAPPLLGGDMTKALIDAAAGEVIDQSPFHVNRIMKTLYASHNLAHVHPHAANWALNGIEMALWDLIGKACGRPLSEVWGGPFREEVLFYGYVERQSPEAMEMEARRLVDEGFTTLYTKVGLGRQDDIAAVAAIRAGAPSLDIRIRIDPNQSWSPGEAITMIRELDRFGLEMVDQPVLMFNLDALKRVKEAVSVPIAAHESSWTMYEVLNVVKHQAADAIHVDPVFDMGLTGARVSAGIAESAGLPVIAHAYGYLGIGFAAVLQLTAATPNFTLANQEGSYGFLTDDIIVGGPIRLHGGRAPVPTGPGLGVSLDAEKLHRYREVYAREVGPASASRNLHAAFYRAMHLRPYLAARRPR